MARFSVRGLTGARLPSVDLEGDKPWHLVAQVVRSAVRHRTSGHAAEMAFFAVLTLVPSTIAVGAALGFSERFVGPAPVADAENAAIRGIRALIGPELTDTVIAPFVHLQLSQPKGGIAIGGLLIAWWLSSHLFAATGHALDIAYGVKDRRATVLQRFIALAFALGSVVMVALTVELMVNGPLGRTGGIARDRGLAEVYTTAWSFLRWPLLLGIVVTFLLCLYRYSPNVQLSWRDCLPGAVVGAGLWIVAAIAFRLSAAAGLRGSSGVAADDPAVQIIGQSVNAVVATVLWAYLASVAILVGGEFNVVLRERRAIQAALAAAAMPRHANGSTNGRAAMVFEEDEEVIFQGRS
jgi:membrane protein